MLLKYTLRNIFTKKGRLIILMFCIIIACFTANLALDFSTTVKNSVKTSLTGVYGDTDYRLISVSNVDAFDEHSFDDAPCPVRYTGVYTMTKREESRKEEAYYAVITDNVRVTSFSDIDAARDMGLFNNIEVPGMGEIAIGSRYAKKFGYQVGDTIIVYDIYNDEVPLKVSSIFTENVFLGGDSAGLFALISFEQYEAINGEAPLRNCFLQLLKKGANEDFEEYLNDKYRGITWYNLHADESLEKLLNNLVSFIYLIFVLVFILVIFVTVSFTEKIITERMSVIGTLRSIGMSIYKTTFILLFENILYGLSGGIIAMILYLVFHFLIKIVAPSIFGGVGAPDPIKLLAVILAAVLIEVLVPLKEVLQAVKTSIRDIIFESRDSEYRINYPSTVFGFVCTAAGIVLGLTTNNIIVSAVALLLIILGGGLFIRFVVRKVTWGMAKHFDKRNKPVAELAAKECGSKKPNSGNAVLAITTICASTAIFVAGASFVGGVSGLDYDTDILVTDTKYKENKYEYLNELEGVTSLEFLYKSDDTVKILGKEYMVDVWRNPEGGSYVPFKDTDKNLAKDEIILDVTSARHANAKVGDKITIVFHSTSLFPVEKEFTVKQIVNPNKLDLLGKIILSKEAYNEMYPKEVSMIAIESDNIAVSEEAVSDALTGGEGVQNINDINREARKSSALTIAGIMIAIIASVALTLVGISGNQVIGFIGRKKEYAMLHSCACDQSSIIRMIWIENALLFGVSVLAAGILSVPVIVIINHIFVIIEIGIYSTPPYGLIFISLIILWIITMLTTLSPIKNLKRMNTATEMKYE